MASFVFLSAALGAVVTATAPAAARPAAAEPSPRASSVKIYRALNLDACEALAASLTEANAQQNGTRWLSAETTPATPLERAVRAVFDLHTSNLAFDAAISGAEYWVQSHVEAGDAPSNGIALHRDFDLGVLEEDGRGGDVEAALPNVSTITYLTSSENSMPTLIFTDFGATAAGAVGVAKEAWAVYPRAGKRSLRRRAWHNVPPAVVWWTSAGARRRAGARRVALLVNVWRVPRKAPRRAAAFGAVDAPLGGGRRRSSTGRRSPGRRGSARATTTLSRRSRCRCLPRWRSRTARRRRATRRQARLPPALVREARGAGEPRRLWRHRVHRARRRCAPTRSGRPRRRAAAVALLRAAESGAADFELAGKLLTRGASVGEVAALLLSG